MKSDFSFILDIWACLGPTLPAPLVAGSQAPEPQVRNLCHISLRNGIAAAQPPTCSVPDGAGATRRQPPGPVTGSIPPVAKCSWFIPILGKAKPPCISGILSREVAIPWWCLGPSCCVYVSFCCKLLQHQPGPTSKVPQSFTISSAPGIVQDLLEDTRGPRETEQPHVLVGTSCIPPMAAPPAQCQAAQHWQKRDTGGDLK